MKKQYKIVKHTTNGNLYYNEDFNIFTERFGTVYSSKRKATEKLQYARKYASGNNLKGTFEIIKREI